MSIADFSIIQRAHTIELRWDQMPGVILGFVAFLGESNGKVKVEIVWKAAARLFLNPKWLQKAYEARWKAKDFRPFQLRSYSGDRLTCDEWLSPEARRPEPIIVGR